MEVSFLGLIIIPPFGMRNAKFARLPPTAVAYLICGVHAWFGRIRNLNPGNYGGKSQEAFVGCE